MSKHSALNRFGRSGNPAFQNHFSSPSQTQSRTDIASPSLQTDIASPTQSTTAQSQYMTLDGTVNKTGMLLVLCAIGAFLGWTNPSPVIIISSVIIGFVLALITTFLSLIHI